MWHFFWGGGLLYFTQKVNIFKPKAIFFLSLSKLHQQDAQLYLRLSLSKYTSPEQQNKPSPKRHQEKGEHRAGIKRL
jgi:hypothetical protein